MKSNHKIHLALLASLLYACGGGSSSDGDLTIDSGNEVDSGNELSLQEGGAGFCSSENNIDSGGSNITIWAIASDEPNSANLEFRYANGSSETYTSEIYVNGIKAGSVDLQGTGASTSWSSASGVVSLNQGNNLIELRANSEQELTEIGSLTVFGQDIRSGTCPTDNSSLTTLPQNGNPVQRRFIEAKTKWSSDKYEIILSHQYDHGGWPKNQDYDDFGVGGTDNGTFDNGATVTEIVFMAQAYLETGEEKYRDSVRKAMSYILNAQYLSGGWPQFYPLRGGYSDHVTFNDNAMASTLTVLENIYQKQLPFNGEFFDDDERDTIRQAIDKGVEYILNAQWRQGDVLTVWCAQHDKDDHLPKPARAYELESLSGSESVEIVGFLMTQQQSPAIKVAISAALAWFRSPTTILENYIYDRETTEKIIPSNGGRMWYRFYDLDTNVGFFSDRDGGKYYDIMEISEERREGYSWGGSYGESILSYAESVGY